MKTAALAALAAALEQGEPVPAGDAAELAAAIRDALSGQRRLDEALGLRGGPGERSAATRLMLQRRDILLREAARQHLGGMPAAAQAAALAAAWTRYATTGWPRERGLEVCPERRVGTIEGAFWLAMKAAATPLSAERIRRLLVTSCRYS